MDQDLGLLTKKNEPVPRDSPLAVSSRRGALDRLRSAVGDYEPVHPILITGEPGAGKTWLAGQLVRFLPPQWLRAHVDLTRSMTALDFLQLVGHSAGLPLPDGLGPARARLQSLLHDDRVDGKRWLLLIDDAHRGSLAVWDEIRAVVNLSGRRGGFAAIVVLGETDLARTVATRGLRGFASTIRLHLHLPPLDVDEARDLLRFMGHDHIAPDRVLEELHRDARGNASGLLRLAQARRPADSGLSPERTRRDIAFAWPRTVGQPVTISSDNDEPEKLETSESAAGPPLVEARAGGVRSDSPSLVPSKPPIRVEEGLVEVGWDGDLETEFPDSAEMAIATETLSADDSPLNEELIDDPYAALQAWSEWTGGHESSQSLPIESSMPRSSGEPVSVSRGQGTEEAVRSPEASPATAPAGIRAESQHEFAPYSQLFTRLRQSKQP